MTCATVRGGDAVLWLPVPDGWAVGSAPGPAVVLWDPQCGGDFRANVVARAHRVPGDDPLDVLLDVAAAACDGPDAALERRGRTTVPLAGAEAVAALVVHDPTVAPAGPTVAPRVAQLHAFVRPTAIDASGAPDGVTVFQLVATCRLEDIGAYAEAFGALLTTVAVTRGTRAARR